MGKHLIGPQKTIFSGHHLTNSLLLVKSLIQHGPSSITDLSLLIYQVEMKIFDLKRGSRLCLEKGSRDL